MLRLLCLSLAVLLATIAPAHAAVQNTISVGHDNSLAMFADAPTAWKFCEIGFGATEYDEAACIPAESFASWSTRGTCLSKTEIATALANSPGLFQQLYSRSDVRLTMEMQTGGSNTLSSQIFSFIAREVLGYGIKHVANNGFGDGLQRCMDQKYDLHAEIWRSDYSDAQWQEALFPPSGHGNCRLVGVNGIINYNAWHADTYTIQQAVTNTLPGNQPMALDFWRSYTTDAAVANLPRFDWAVTSTLQMVDRPGFAWIDTNVAGSNHWMNRTSGLIWFVPPICQSGLVTCGIAYAIAPFFNPGLPQQMVHNLGWKVVIQFWDAFGGMYGAATARRASNLQTLIMAGSLDSYVLGHGEWTRVSLPPVTAECLIGSETVHMNGVGHHACDFPQQTLFKTSGINHDSDKADAFSLFNRLSFTHEQIADMLADLAAGNVTEDIACDWVRTNSAIWSTWITEITPRKHIVEVADSSKSIIYAFVALFGAFSIVAHVFLFLHRGHPIVRRSSHLFCQLILFGADLFYAALLVGVQPDTLSTCVASQFLFSVAFTLFYISLLVKTYRIYWIFHSKALQTVKLPDSTMLMYLGAYGLVDLLIVILWAAIDAPTRTIETASADYTLMTTCSSDKTMIFRTILYVLRGVALLTGGILAVRIRDVADDYNESKFLAVVCYNILLMCAIVLGLVLVGTKSPELRVGSWCIGVGIAVFLSVLVFVVPKMMGTRFKLPGLLANGTGQVRDTRGGAPNTQINSGESPSNGVSAAVPLSTAGATTAPRSGGRNGVTPVNARKPSQQMHNGPASPGAAYRQVAPVSQAPPSVEEEHAVPPTVVVHGLAPTDENPGAPGSPSLPGTIGEGEGQ